VTPERGRWLFPTYFADVSSIRHGEHWISSILKVGIPLTSAVVFVLTKYLETDTAQCASYCQAMGYDLVAVVKDNYAAALDALCITGAAVLVVATAETLTDECTPRTEIAEDRSAPGPRGRRIRAFRRNAGA
jgi:hypothetical protein